MPNMLLRSLLLVVSLFASNVAFADTYIHVGGSLGSVIGDKTAQDGSLPFWAAVGITHEPNDEFEIKYEIFHRSNADKSGVSVDSDEKEYSLNGIRVGFEYKIRL